MIVLPLGTLFARGRAARADGVKMRAQAKKLWVASHRLGVVPATFVTLRTDVKGVIRSAGLAAPSLFNLAADRLVGMQLLHFVARRDTRFFRDLILGLGHARAPKQALVHFRPRHGRPELVGATVREAAPNEYEWTLRRRSSQSR